MCHRDFFILLAALLALTACQGTSDVSAVKDGKRYVVTGVPFKGQWWHYYERALSFSDGGFWKESESDLREAIRQRTDDRKSARTYGRHFLNLPEQEPGYFPHRELGIVLYRQGRTEEAIDELVQSLADEKSSRAELYLDRARKTLIEKTGADRLPPDIRILAPEQNLYTSAGTVLISGIARDDTFVRHIRVGTHSVRADVSDKEIPFRIEVPLSSGENRIPVIAADLTGRVSETVLTVHRDCVGPVISIDEYRQQEPNLVIIRGNVFDNSGLSETAVNSEKTPHKGEPEATVEAAVRIGQDQRIIEVSAKDIAGNQTVVSLSLPATAGRSARSEILLAGRAEPFQIRRLVAAVKDSVPPKIGLDRFGDETQTYISYLDEILLSGKITDDENVKSLYFNRDSIRFRGKDNSFSYIFRLDEGENVINIRGTDASGNEARKTVKVVHKKPGVKDYESRMSLEIKEFAENPEKLDLSFDFRDSLDTVMFDYKRFRVITKEEAAKTVDGMLSGNIRKRANYVEISASLFLYQSEGGKQATKRIAKADAYREHDNPKTELSVDRDMIKDMAKEINLKLSYDVPLIEGTVIETVEGQKIATSLGEETNVKTDMDLIVFQKNMKEPDKDFKKLGRAKIEDVRQAKSHAKLKEGNPAQIKAGQHVITR